MLAEFSAEKRIFIPINSMPENVINAFVSAEDKNFFKHNGLDFKSILKKRIQNLKNNLGHTQRWSNPVCLHYIKF